MIFKSVAIYRSLQIFVYEIETTTAWGRLRYYISFNSTMVAKIESNVCSALASIEQAISQNANYKPG